MYERVRLKYLAEFAAGGTPPTTEPAYWASPGETGIRWITISDMTQGDPVTDTERRLSEEGVKAGGLEVGPAGTLLFSMYASLGTVVELGAPATWNQAILGIHPKRDRIHPRFLKYALRAIGGSTSALARSNTQDNLTAEQVRNIQAPVPPLDEQRRIANFLDTETKRMHVVVGAKHRHLKLLAEKRQALYWHGATGRLGLACDRRPVPHLPWVDSIPEHWRVAKLSLIARLGTGHTPSRREEAYWNTERTIPWLTTSDIAQFREDQIDIITETRETISQAGLDNSSAVLHPQGTVAVSRTASVGFSVIMGTDMATSQDFVTWTCSPRLEPGFLLVCLRAMRSHLVGRLAIGSTHKTIYMPDVESLRVPLPPVEEQKRIVNDIERQRRGLDELAARIRQQMPLLAERHSAVITAAVTGQLDPSSYRDPAVGAAA